MKSQSPLPLHNQQLGREIFLGHQLMQNCRYLHQAKKTNDISYYVVHLCKTASDEVDALHKQ